MLVFISVLSPVTSPPSLPMLLLFVLPVFPPLRIALSWGQAEGRIWKRKEDSSLLHSYHSLLFPLYSFFLLTWQRDNPSRFTSSEFTFTTSRTTYLILKSYMAEWYHSRMSGISAFPEGCDAFWLQTSGFDEARGAWDFVGKGGTHKDRILTFVMGSFGLDSVLKKGGDVLGLR